jgi:acyl-CoA thioester hydrolase
VAGRERLPAPVGQARVVPSPVGPVVETAVRVRFAETDAMGVVYHTNYIIWFEVGRGAYWRAMGLQDAAMPQDAGSFPVSAVEARFHAPARYGDVVIIRAWIRETRTRSVTFGYECVLQATGQRLVSGQTTHLFLDADGHARRLPEAVRRTLPG